METKELRELSAILADIIGAVPSEAAEIENAFWAFAEDAGINVKNNKEQ